MRAVRRALAAACGVAGAVGLVLCVAGVVGCWAAYAEAVRRADRTFGRAEDSLGDVRDGLRGAGDRVRLARQKVDTLREQVLARPRAEQVRATTRELAEACRPLLAEARQRLVQATESALGLQGLLDALAELPLGERIGLEPAPLRDASDRLGELIRLFERLSAALEQTAPDPTADPWRLSEPLDRVAAAADAGAGRVDTARERVRGWHARVVGWLTTVAAVVTLLLGWIGLGQASLLVHGYAVAMRRSDGDRPPEQRVHRRPVGQ